ncbi:MAG: Uma2 family endonuclease [Symploca sp. SIO2E6]|nr:Uma2 family endonuclease [Symploca sp. SIO2E6]
MVQTLTQPKTISLLVPTSIVLHVTHEQFEALAQANRDLRLERTAQGELIVNPPTGGSSGRRNRIITGQLDRWFEENEELGEAFDSSTGFKLPNGAECSPDASWVSRQRWDTLTKEQQEGIMPLCPDFVIELRSKSDNLKPLQTKMQQYLDNGTKLGWLIDPKNQRVEVYRRGQKVQILENPIELSGEDILPGFVLELRRIWQ